MIEKTVGRLRSMMRSSGRIRRLDQETLETRLALTGAPLSPVLDLQVINGVSSNNLDRVSSWQDLSPSGNDLFATGGERPILGSTQTPTGIDAISFDGVENRLLRDLNDPGGIANLPVGDQSRSMFLVAQFHNGSVSGGAAFGTGADQQAFAISTAGLGADHGAIQVAGFGPDDDYTSTADGFSFRNATTGWMLISVVHEEDGTDPADNNDLYRNGSLIGSFSQDYDTKLDVTDNVGDNTASRDCGWRGDWRPGQHPNGRGRSGRLRSSALGHRTSIRRGSPDVAISLVAHGTAANRWTGHLA